MAHKEPTGQRKPMTEEAKAKISEAVRIAAAKKREEQGLPPITNSSSSIPAPAFLERPLELVKMSEQNFSPDLFVPMKTNKPIDLIFTSEGGVPKACNYMLIGDPGIGKSTVSLDIISDLKQAGYRVLLIQAEMTRIDLYGYVQRYPKFGEIDIIFTGEYCESNPKTVIESALKPGYDVVLIDSFVEVQEDIKEVLKLSTAGSEKWLIDLMISHNLAKNDRGLHTTFIAIQQVTKGGVFVGSNKIKHAFTGSMELRYAADTTDSYITFTKNRRGPVNKRMYFSLGTIENVVYDLRRFSNDEDARSALTQERALIEEESENFDKLFGTVELVKQNGDI